MSQRHPRQHGLFHITTNALDRVSWCTEDGIPQIIIDNLSMTRNVLGAHVYAFCVLPDHIHIVVEPGRKGLSAFVHSFKRNCSRDISNITGMEGAKWQKGYFDVWIINDMQTWETLRYVEENAVKHNLVDSSVDWPWTSKHFRGLLDEC